MPSSLSIAVLFASGAVRVLQFSLASGKQLGQAKLGSSAKGAAATRAGRAPGTAGHGRGMTTQAAMLGAGGLQQATLLVTAEAITAAALAAKASRANRRELGFGCRRLLLSLSYRPESGPRRGATIAAVRRQKPSCASPSASF